MHFFGACVLIFSAIANNLQAAELNGTINTWSARPRARLEINPKFVTGMGHKLILKKLNESLNLTCTVVHQNGDKNDSLFDWTVDWRIPHHTNNNLIERGQGKNIAWLWFDRLTEKDGGNYTCNAITTIPVGQPSISINIYLSVKSKPMYCGSQFFRCRSTLCIPERYVCDGKEDCDEGEDESIEANCELDPCKDKVFCNDRCIPPEWCCDHRNCSTTFGLRPWPPEIHEISYVQTAFYTVIGCAMAFMFIVTILVIAICRVQIKRAMSSRWTQQNRDICRRPGRPVPLSMPMYDVDVYLNRSADSYPQGVSIMYNINSGVQFVGRPVEPPPYSEVIAAPPREGPPPPYVSCENLIRQTPMAVITSESNNLRQSGDPMMVNSEHDTLDGCELLSASTASHSIAAPQVPSGSIASVLTTDISPLVNYNNLTSKLSNRIQTLDLEYEETDALLPQCSQSKIEIQTKDLSWKPYNWLMQHETEQVTVADDRYDDKINENIPNSPLRGKVCSLDNCENEGMFLETDQRESSSNLQILNNNSILSRNTLDQSKAGPSTSNYDINESLCNATKQVDEFDGRNLIPNRETSHSNDSSNKSLESSIKVSTILSASDDIATIESDTQVQDSQPLVLPLRESFIGIQRDS